MTVFKTISWEPSCNMFHDEKYGKFNKAGLKFFQS